MDDRTAAIRTMLSSMAPVKAIPLVKSFQLPEQEEFFILEHEVKKKDLTYLADTYGLSVRAVKHRRKQGLMKIYQSLYE